MMMIWIFVGGAVLFALISMSATSPGRSLQRKFVALGTLSGKSRRQIEAAVGAPTSISGMPNGVLLQWMASGYHIALIFNNEGICQGVSHEHAA